MRSGSPRRFYTSILTLAAAGALLLAACSGRSTDAQAEASDDSRTAEAPLLPEAGLPSPTTPAAAPLAAPQAAPSPDWGNLTGRIVWAEDAELPEIEILVEAGDTSVRDHECCAEHSIPSQALVVDPETLGIANVFLFPIETPQPVHPDLAEPPAEPVVFNQEHCTFEPHALVARVGQGVRVISSDPIEHNTHSFPLRNRGQNVLLQPNDDVGVLFEFTQAERLPVEIKCDIHPWMRGYWLIVDHPYAAVTAADGSFTIENLPPGEHQYVLWQESVGYLRNSRREPIVVQITGGETTDLGDLVFGPADFTRDR